MTIFTLEDYERLFLKMSLGGGGYGITPSKERGPGALLQKLLENYMGSRKIPSTLFQLIKIVYNYCCDFCKGSFFMLSISQLKQEKFVCCLMLR